MPKKRFSFGQLPTKKIAIIGAIVVITIIIPIIVIAVVKNKPAPASTPPTLTSGYIDKTKNTPLIITPKGVIKTGLTDPSTIVEQVKNYYNIISLFSDGGFKIFKVYDVSTLNEDKDFIKNTDPSAIQITSYILDASGNYIDNVPGLYTTRTPIYYTGAKQIPPYDTKNPSVDISNVKKYLDAKIKYNVIGYYSDGGFRLYNITGTPPIITSPAAAVPTSVVTNF